MNAVGTFNASFSDYAESVSPIIEDAIFKYLPIPLHGNKTELRKAVKYAVFPGGKRIRPILTLLGAELFETDLQKILPAAVAVEYVHTSSLIFDDLPCMDDARERRGQPCVHEKFGQGLAILAALSLLNASYGLIFADRTTDSELALKAHNELVSCVGTSGMTCGQSIDIASQKNAYLMTGNFTQTESLKYLKTSALIRLSLSIGVIMAGINGTHLEQLTNFSELFGQAYQLSDDLADVEEDGANLTADEKNLIANNKTKLGDSLQNTIHKANGILLDNFSQSEARDSLIDLCTSFSPRPSEAH